MGCMASSQPYTGVYSKSEIGEEKVWRHVRLAKWKLDTDHRSRLVWRVSVVCVGQIPGIVAMEITSVTLAFSIRQR